MAGNISLSFGTATSSGNTYKVPISLYYYGNGVSWNGDACSFTITSGSSSQSGTSTFSTSTSAQLLGTKTFSFTKGTISSTVNISASFVTGTSLETLTTSKSLTIPAGNYTYTIKYNKNNATSPSGTINDKPVTYGTHFDANPNATVSRTNYELTGWLDPTGANWKDFSGTWTYTNGKWGITNNILSLKAQWTPVYEITYNSNGGSGSMNSTSCTSGKTVNLSKNTFTPPQGYSFIGWSTNRGDTVPLYGDRASISITKNTPLYAIWADSYTPPKISNARIVRCHSEGTENIAGEYIKLIFEWQAGITGSSGASQYMSYTVSAPFNITGSLDSPSNIGGTITTDPIAYSLGSTATVTLSLIDGDTSGETVTQTLTIPEGSLTMHINSTGTGIRFLGIAKEEDKGLYIENTNIGNWIKAPYINQQNSGSDVYYIAEQGDYKIGIGVSKSGTHGIWDYHAGKWLITNDGTNTRILCEGLTYPFRDHVIDRGETTRTSGGNTMNWTYERYVSGKAECWGYLTTRSIAITNTIGNGYRSASFTYYFPQYKDDNGNYTDLFNHYPVVTASAWNGATYSTLNASINNLDSTTVSIIYTDITSNTNSAQVYIHAIGTWRTYRTQL